MPTASRVLGDQLGPAAPVFLAFLAIHVVAGLTAVVAALARKGSPRHIRAGRWFYRAITVVFASATILAAMRWRQDYYLFIIGAVAVAAATAGYQHRRRRGPGDTGHIAGMGTGYIAMRTAFYVDTAPTCPYGTGIPHREGNGMPTRPAGWPALSQPVALAHRHIPGSHSVTAVTNDTRPVCHEDRLPARAVQGGEGRWQEHRTRRRPVSRLSRAAGAAVIRCCSPSRQRPWR